MIAGVFSKSAPTRAAGNNPLLHNKSFSEKWCTRDFLVFQVDWRTVVELAGHCIASQTTETISASPTTAHIMLTLILLYLAALVSASVDHTVLNTPNVVRAGEPFTIFTNLAAAHWPIPDCQGPGRCDMKYLRVYMMGDPTYETMTDRGGPAIIWRQYCTSR